MAQGSNDGPVLVHVVLISFRDTATAEQRQRIFADHQGLGERCGGKDAGILFWQSVITWISARIGICSNSPFFATTTRCSASACIPSTVVREIADWVVGNMLSVLSID
jgi:hypothetical protein